MTLGRSEIARCDNNLWLVFKLQCFNAFISVNFLSAWMKLHSFKLVFHCFPQQLFLLLRNKYEISLPKHNQYATNYLCINFYLIVRFDVDIVIWLSLFSINIIDKINFRLTELFELIIILLMLWSIPWSVHSCDNIYIHYTY